MTGPQLHPRRTTAEVEAAGRRYLRLVKDGHSVPEIADQFGVARSTVANDMTATRRNPHRAPWSYCDGELLREARLGHAEIQAAEQRLKGRR